MGVLFLPLALLTFAFKGYSQVKTGNPQNTITSTSLNAKKAATTYIQYFIIAVDSNCYGYTIYTDGNLYIQQKTIPGLAGNKGFTDTASAGKIARLVIKKMRQGQMPPSVTIKDLNKLNIQL